MIRMKLILYTSSEQFVPEHEHEVTLRLVGQWSLARVLGCFAYLRLA